MEFHGRTLGVPLSDAIAHHASQPRRRGSAEIDAWREVLGATTKGMDFDDADLVGPVDFNRILWKGIMGKQPFPAPPTKLDLRENREELLARYQRSLGKQGTN